mmetsp:Transcript_34860/g.41074  ORF Transcript_34860/g.41074 Transcript_34860/m.41074 type:complete len:94 (+) Transcript_34860:678-959(+)
MRTLVSKWGISSKPREFGRRVLALVLLDTFPLDMVEVPEVAVAFALQEGPRERFEASGPFVTAEGLSPGWILGPRDSKANLILVKSGRPTTNG